MNKLLAAVIGLAMLPCAVRAQEDDGKKVTLRGSIQSDVLIPQEDGKIGTGTYSDWGLTNTYAELHLINKYVSAGARLEYLDHPLPGFEPDFKGAGIPYFYLKGRYKWAELTLGDFYEQFGSGFILRTYEERSLGVDNSLRGGRLTLKPVKGVSLKLLGGQQRHYWKNRDFGNFSLFGKDDTWVYGGDVELSLSSWIKKMEETGTHLTLGFSAVSKHEGTEGAENLVRVETDFDEEGMPVLKGYPLNLPQNVAAFDVRANLQKGNYNFLAEYAWKGQDPSFDNGYIYHKGNALLLSGSYSKRGMSVLLQAKRSQNMSFRSDRFVNGTSCFINHMPAFTQQHTYTLAALYPYATQNGRYGKTEAEQVPGEWAFQGELSYNFKRKTPLGGKYGTTVKVNFSHVRSINYKNIATGEDVMGTDGYKTHTLRLGEPGGNFFGMGGNIFYQDLNVQVEKKLTKKFKLNLMYMNQRYNKSIVEGEGGTIKSNIAVAEGKYQFNSKLTLRGEAQYLHTRQDQKDWWFGLLELSVLPHFMFTVSDTYNAHVPEQGKDGATNKVHYYMFTACYTHKAHRLQVGYGKTRAGYNCSGGVCRYVPASKGVQLSYNFNF